MGISLSDRISCEFISDIPYDGPIETHEDNGLSDFTSKTVERLHTGTRTGVVLSGTHDNLYLQYYEEALIIPGMRLQLKAAVW